YNGRKEFDEAVRWLRKGLDLDPKNAEATKGLGQAYTEKGQYDEAVRWLEKALALEPDDGEAHNRLLPALNLAKRSRAAAAAAEQARRVVPAEEWPPVRYNAACAMALAGCGFGDAAELGSAERARLRRQAYAWLGDELKDCAEAARKPAAGSPAERLRALLGDEDFRGVRDPKALAELPADERAEWSTFWQGARQLLEKLNPPPK